MANDKQAQAHGHPTPATFYRIAAILGAITAIEFGIVYLQGLQGLIWAVLGILSVTKFYLVATYFMHLRFDNRFLGWIFAFGAVLASLMTIALKFVNRA